MTVAALMLALIPATARAAAPGWLVVGDTDGGTIVFDQGPGDALTFALAARPEAEVSIEFHAWPHVVASPTALIFTQGNWAVPQFVQLSYQSTPGSSNSMYFNVTYVATSSDPDLNNATGAVYDLTAVPANHDDLPGGVNALDVKHCNGDALTADSQWRLAEGDRATTCIFAHMRPAGAVTVTIGKLPEGIRVAQQSVTIDQSNWRTPVPLTAWRVKDARIGPYRSWYDLPLSSSAANPADAAQLTGLQLASFGFGVVDDDQPAFEVVYDRAPRLTEGGPALRAWVRLKRGPLPCRVQLAMHPAPGAPPNLRTAGSMFVPVTAFRRHPGEFTIWLEDDAIATRAANSVPVLFTLIPQDGGACRDTLESYMTQSLLRDSEVFTLQQLAVSTVDNDRRTRRGTHLGCSLFAHTRSGNRPWAIPRLSARPALGWALVPWRIEARVRGRWQTVSDYRDHIIMAQFKPPRPTSLPPFFGEAAPPAADMMRFSVRSFRDDGRSYRGCSSMLPIRSMPSRGWSTPPLTLPAEPN